MHIWNHSAIKARLAHLQSKAHFMHDIMITDDGDGYQSSAPLNESRPFPPAFIPELLSTLHMLGPLDSVSLSTHSSWDLPNAIFSAELWKWIVEVSPPSLYVVGHFEVPLGETFQPIENLEHLCFNVCSNGIIKALLDVSQFTYFEFGLVNDHNTVTETLQPLLLFCF
jgi:hypothetical protein